VGPRPVWSWLLTITCSLTQGTNMYMVYGWGSQRFSRYWSTSGLRGMQPFRMVMISIPSNAPWHKEQKYIWSMGGISTVSNIFEHLWFQGYGTTPYDHDLPNIRCYLSQDQENIIFIDFTPSSATWHKKQEYIWFRNGDINGFWDIRTFPV
jgi:hypothetical protein